jgi:hypothetical protein
MAKTKKGDDKSKPAKSGHSRALATNPVPPQLEGKGFQPGNSGNPKGGKRGNIQVLQKLYLQNLHEHWESKGANILAEAPPAAILKAMGDIMPKDLNVKHDASETFLKLWKAMATGKVPEFKGDDDED